MSGGYQPIHHEIVSLSFKKAYNGDLWPQWHCRCGGSDYVPTGVYTSAEEAQNTCKKEAAAHVINANKSEAILAATNGRFAF